MNLSYKIWRLLLGIFLGIFTHKYEGSKTSIKIGEDVRGINKTKSVKSLCQKSAGSCNFGSVCSQLLFEVLVLPIHDEVHHFSGRGEGHHIASIISLVYRLTFLNNDTMLLLISLDPIQRAEQGVLDLSWLKLHFRARGPPKGYHKSAGEDACRFAAVKNTFTCAWNRP